MVNHKRCIKDLDTYDVAGIKLRHSPSLHLSGNFWWTNADYYLKLPDTIGEKYNDPEFYIGLLAPRMIIYSNTDINCYEYNIFPNFYVDA